MFIVAQLTLVDLSTPYPVERSLSLASLRAGSPLSHAREQRRAKRSGGNESGEEVSRMVTYHFYFIIFIIYFYFYYF